VVAAITISPPAVPARLDARGAGPRRFGGTVQPGDRHAVGREDRQNLLWAARDEGRVQLRLPRRDNLRLAGLTVMVRPACRRLLEVADESADAAGRTVFLAWSGHPRGPQRPPRGTAPASNPSAGARS
jgi:hypothetical protein